MVVLLGLIIGSGIGYLLRDRIIQVLLFSRTQPLVYSTPAGGLGFVFKISLLFGSLVCIPLGLYQVLAFVKPLFPKASRHLFWPTMVSSLVLLVSGVSFAYWVSLPTALRFLSGFGTPQVQSLLSAQEYLSFVTIYILGFGLFFQLPLVLLLVNQIRPLSVKSLLSSERLVILISFIAAAILTPTPDLVNQILMAAPIIVLFQISIVIIWLTNRSRRPTH